MKQETKIVAIVLILLIVFLSGFGLGATRGININVNGGTVQAGASAQQPADTQPAAPATTAPAAPVTDAPATEAPATEAPEADAPATEAPAADAGASAGAIPQTKAEIAAAYNKAINDAKAYTGKVTLKKHDIISVELKDLPSIAAAIINPVIANLTKTEPQEETFENGKGTADNTRELIKWIIPGGGRQATVQEASLANATATANTDGGYTMVLTFIAETANFDGTQNTSEPTQHMTAMDPLNLGTLDLPDAISITNADMKYPGATMTATVDAQGRLVKLEQKLPLEGTGTGKAGISITLNISGSMDGTYEFTYA